MSQLPIVERLKRQAITVSDISREMSEAKSLRQESNTERRTDLYAWPTPEQTTEGKAADLIAELASVLRELVYGGGGHVWTRARELLAKIESDHG